MDETATIDFVVHGQQSSQEINFSQFQGFVKFLKIYNRRTLGISDIFDNTEKGIPLYINKRSTPDSWFQWSLNWWNPLEPIGSEGNIIITFDVFGNANYFNEYSLQGLITASQWVGANWKDYIFSITREGFPVEVL